MSLERNGKLPPTQAQLGRARGWGVFWGIVLGIPLAPLCVWAFIEFALPHAAYRVFVAIDPDAPGAVVRAEIDGWPLTPRLVAAGGVEYALERTNRRRSELIVEFRRDGATISQRAAATLEHRRCDIVVVFDAAGGAASDCAYHFNF